MPIISTFSSAFFLRGANSRPSVLSYSDVLYMYVCTCSLDFKYPDTFSVQVSIRLLHSQSCLKMQRVHSCTPSWPPVWLVSSWPCSDAYGQIATTGTTSTIPHGHIGTYKQATSWRDFARSHLSMTITFQPGTRDINSRALSTSIQQITNYSYQYLSRNTYITHQLLQLLTIQNRYPDSSFKVSTHNQKEKMSKPGGPRRPRLLPCPPSPRPGVPPAAWSGKNLVERYRQEVGSEEMLEGLEGLQFHYSYHVRE